MDGVDCERVYSARGARGLWGDFIKIELAQSEVPNWQQVGHISIVLNCTIKCKCLNILGFKE